MGRPPSVTDDEAILLIQKYIQHFKTNSFPASGEQVWKDMSNDLNGRWKPHSVYTHVRENKKDHLKTARSILGIQVDTPSSVAVNVADDFNIFHEPSVASETDDHSLYHDDEDEHDNADEHGVKAGYEWFDLTLSAAEWEQIRPSSDASASQKRRLRPRVWANIITMAIWNRYAIQCAFLGSYSYLRLQTSDEDDGSFLMKFKALCASKTCNNKLSGIGDKNPENNVLHLRFKCRDTRNEYHEEVKRPLNGLERKKTGQILMKRGAAGLHDEKIGKHMQFGENVPFFVQEKHIYRQAKQEAIKAGLGVKLKCKTNVIAAIQELAMESRYADAIQSIGAKEFFVFFCTKEQIYVFKEYCRVTKDFSKICLDATGKVVRSFEICPGRMTGHIFLYTVTINFEGETIPVLQVLTERHDQTFLAFWLQNWIRILGVSPPKEAVSDRERALLLAMCDSFNHQTIKEYVDVCFAWAQKTISERPPRPANTIIREDVAHLLASVSRWKCIKNINHPSIRSFYIRLVALMIDCQNLKDFEKVFQLTCVIALHHYEDTPVNIPGMKQSTVLEARQTLENHVAVRGRIIEDLETSASHICVNKVSDNIVIPNEENDSNKLTLTHGWIKKLIAQAKPGTLQEKESFIVNAFFFEAFIPDLERIAKEFPLWTGAAIPNGSKHASTACQEGYFASLRPRVFENIPLPCAANRFLKVYIDHVRSRTNLVAAKLKHFNHANAHKAPIPSVRDDESVLSLQTERVNLKLCSTPLPTNGNFLNDSDFKAKEHWYGLINDDRPFLRDEEEFEQTPPDEKEPNRTSALLSEFLDLDTGAIIDIVDNSVFTNEKNYDQDRQLVNTKQHSVIEISDESEVVDRNEENSFLSMTSLSSLVYRSPIHSSTPLNLDHSYALSPLKEKKNVATKNKLTKVAAPSHYFKPYPEGRIINAGIVDTGFAPKRGYLLPNGNICRVLRVDSMAVSVQETCPYDTIMQIMQFGAIDYPQYNAAIQASRNKALKFVTKLIKTGPTTEILRERICILKEFYTLTKDPKATSLSPYFLNAHDSIGGIWRKLFLDSEPSEPSALKTYQCNGSRCVRQETIKVPFLSVNTRIIGRYGGFQAIEKALDYYPQICNIKCRQATCTGLVTETTSLNMHILIETDVRTEERPQPRRQCRLADLPVTLNLEKQYRLIGVVDFLSSYFVAYCRRATGNWIECDGLKAKIKECQNTKEITPDGAIYIRL